MFKKIFNLNKLASIIFYLSILIFIIAFNFAHNPPSGWYQQFLPNLNGRGISDIFFLDSLTGWAVTASLGQNDTAYILKTTNGGDNWSIHYVRTGAQFLGYKRIYFLNESIGFTCGVTQFNVFSGLNKSTDGGLSWINLNIPDPFAGYDDMFVLNEDTIWLAAQGFPEGGLFRSTNGGTNWTLQFSSNFNPDKIYMFNRNIGFISAGSGLLKTTNSGQSWTGIPGAGNFLDIYFADSLTGWLARGNIYKTTNGGFNWIVQTLPTGGYISESEISNFDNLNKDTIWGVGGNVFYGAGQGRGIIYRTTNGGENWLYQIPDTSIHIGVYTKVDFDNKLIGWAYFPLLTGIHTKRGGDSIFTKITSQNLNIPADFTLNQNYPNPFNPVTVIGYQLTVSKHVLIKIFDINGKEIAKLINIKQNTGAYQVEFDASGLSSGIYFYSLFIDGERMDTKKMVLVR